MSVIYLDNNATTPLDERVLEAMLPYLKEHFGNPSSKAHAYGWTAKAAVDVAREELATAIGASPEEIFFTSGATEADNWVLLGVLYPGEHLVTAATEHEAVLETGRYLERCGVRVTVLPVDRFGVVAPETLREAITPETTLVSIMLANNETGTLNPVAEMAEVAHEAGVSFHTDAAQALGKIPVNVEKLGVDLMSLSAHKCYGPKGIGALYVRRRPRGGARRVRPAPLLHGGGQERGLRSGTLNVLGIVGFGRAATLAADALPEEPERIAALRDKLWERISVSVPGVHLNGHPAERLPNTLNMSFPGLRSANLLEALPEIAASSGSACASSRGAVARLARDRPGQRACAFLCPVQPRPVHHTRGGGTRCGAGNGCGERVRSLVRRDGAAMMDSFTKLLRNAKARGDKLVMISLYDAPSAALSCDAGVDMILVGDSLGNVVLGYDNPLRVTMDDMLRHTEAVTRGVRRSSRPDVPVIADTPFASYASVQLATENGAHLVRAGARALKLEGAGRSSLRAVRALVEMGVPVMGHLGFTPQSSLKFEGVVQGKNVDAAAKLLEEARSLEAAGCCTLVLEAVPAEVAQRITGELAISTIGIGAGLHCDAQVLVWHDLVGLNPDPPLRFVRRYAEANTLLKSATEEFVSEVRSGAFPKPEHGWAMDEAERAAWESKENGEPSRRGEGDR